MASAIPLIKFTPLRLSFLLHPTFRHILPVSTISACYPFTHILIGAFNRQFLPPSLAGWRFELKLARIPTEPDQSKIAFEVRSDTLDECFRRIAGTHSA